MIERLRGVQIEHDDATTVLARFDRPSTLHYVDPPYLPDARSERWRSKAYHCELTAEDHAALLAALQRLEGMVVLSGYDSELYHNTLRGWSVRRRRARNDVGERTEVLWLNPAAQERHRQVAIAFHPPQEAARA